MPAVEVEVLNAPNHRTHGSDRGEDQDEPGGEETEDLLREL
jgi:hypothetical protein